MPLRLREVGSSQLSQIAPRLTLVEIDGAEGRPLQIQLLEFPSAEALRADMANPRRTALASGPDRAISKTALINVQLV